MPELPEVETVVRTLRPRLLGQTMTGVWWSGKKLRLAKAPDLGGLRRLCVDGRVAGVRRRAKYILIDVRGAAESGAVVLVHLGMTGRLAIAPVGAPRAAHTHLIWSLGAAQELRFVDPRRFGWVRAAPSDDALPELRGLGPDPLSELDEGTLRAGLASSGAPVKSFLLDQKRVVGIGNIYACEALFRAQVHPATPARRTANRAAALLAAIRQVLELGIANRGTTLRDYVDGDGREGENQEALLVYGREGKACMRCGPGDGTRTRGRDVEAVKVLRIVQSARSTFFCARCQKR